MKTPIEAILDKLDWNPVDPPKEITHLPYVTHSGVMNIAGQSLNVHMLSNGQRIIPAEDIERFFGDGGILENMVI